MVNDKSLSQRALATRLKNDGTVVMHQSTVCRRLNETGVKAYVCTKKQFISPKNKGKRLQFAKAHINKELTFWQDVLFTDEPSVYSDGI